MSWQAFVDTSLVGTTHVTKGAIISIAGDSAWASSPDLTIAPAEMLAIVDIVNKAPGAEDKAYAEGLYIGGVRYVLTKNDEDIYARSGRDGVAITAAKSCVVIGLHNETQTAGSATIAVAALADHLKKTGY
ncbi:profilin [Trichoderma austrokoningii]